jgi:hypothetical protein
LQIGSAWQTVHRKWTAWIPRSRGSSWTFPKNMEKKWGSQPLAPQPLIPGSQRPGASRCSWFHGL